MITLVPTQLGPTIGATFQGTLCLVMVLTNGSLLHTYMYLGLT